MDVADQRVHGLERAHAVHAGALEVDRVEVHQDVRPVDPLQDVPADVGMERRAVVVFEHEGHVRVPVRQAPQIRADGLEGALRVVLEFQPAEEQAELRGAELVGDVDLTRHRPIGLRRFAAPPWKKSHHPPDTTQM